MKLSEICMLLGYRTPGLIAERLVQRAQLRSSLKLIKNVRCRKTSLRRKDKIDQFISGFGDLKGLTRFSQSLFFSFSIKEKTKGGSAPCLLETLRTTQWKFRWKPSKESKIHNVAIEHLLLLNMKLMAENARRKKEWRLSFKRFRLCKM